MTALAETSNPTLKANLILPILSGNTPPHSNVLQLIPMILMLMAYLFHAAANTWTQVFSIDHTNRFIDWTFTGLIVLASVIVVLGSGAENLSRKNIRVQE